MKEMLSSELTINGNGQGYSTGPAWWQYGNSVITNGYFYGYAVGNACKGNRESDGKVVGGGFIDNDGAYMISERNLYLNRDGFVGGTCSYMEEYFINEDE